MSKRKTVMLVLVVFALNLGVPHLVMAGSLEPSGPAATTMMKTLDEIPPTWSQTLPASGRFKLVLNNEAVLDKETGLVWQRSPDSFVQEERFFHCYNKTIGNRKGWRIPTIEEMTSLIDPTETNPALPSGHPFTNVYNGDYQTATRTTENSSTYWCVAIRAP